MTSRNAYSTNQRANEEDYQIDTHPEASISQSQMTQNFGPEGTHDSGSLQNKHNTHNFAFSRSFFYKTIFLQNPSSKTKDVQETESMRSGQDTSGSEPPEKNKNPGEECSGKSTKFCSFLNKSYLYSRMLKLCLEHANRSKFIRGSENCWKCWGAFRFFPVAYWKEKILLTSNLRK